MNAGCAARRRCSPPQRCEMPASGHCVGCATAASGTSCLGCMVAGVLGNAAAWEVKTPTDAALQRAQHEWLSTVRDPILTAWSSNIGEKAACETIRPAGAQHCGSLVSEWLRLAWLSLRASCRRSQMAAIVMLWNLTAAQ